MKSLLSKRLPSRWIVFPQQHLRSLVAVLLAANVVRAQFGGGIYGGIGGHPLGGVGLHPGAGFGVGGFHDPFYHPHIHDPLLHQALHTPVYRQPRVVVRQPREPEAPRNLFADGTPVLRLSSSEFPGKDTTDLWLIMFHDGGQASAAAKPAVETLAKSVNQKMSYQVASYDCRKDEKGICSSRLGEGYNLPTFSFFDGGPYMPLRYKEKVSAKLLDEFAKDNMPFHLVHPVNHRSKLRRFKAAVAKEPQFGGKAIGAVVLLSDKPETSTLYYVLAQRYRHELSFGEVQGGSHVRMLSAFGLPEDVDHRYPILVAWRSSTVSTADEAGETTQQMLRYEGPMKGDDISKWLEAHVIDNRMAGGNYEQGDQAPSPFFQVQTSEDLHGYFLQNVTRTYGSVLALKKDNRPDLLFGEVAGKFSQYFNFAESIPELAEAELAKMLWKNGKPEFGQTYPFYTLWTRNEKNDRHIVVWHRGPNTKKHLSDWLHASVGSVRRIRTKEELEEQLLGPSATTGCAILLIANDGKDAKLFDTLATNRWGKFSFGKVERPSQSMLQFLSENGVISRNPTFPMVVALAATDWSAERNERKLTLERYGGRVEERPMTAWLDQLHKFTNETKQPATGIVTAQNQKVGAESTQPDGTDELKESSTCEDCATKQEARAHHDSQEDSNSHENSRNDLSSDDTNFDIPDSESPENSRNALIEGDQYEFDGYNLHEEDDMRGSKNSEDNDAEILDLDENNEVKTSSTSNHLAADGEVQANQDEYVEEPIVFGEADQFLGESNSAENARDCLKIDVQNEFNDDAKEEGTRRLKKTEKRNNLVDENRASKESEDDLVTIGLDADHPNEFDDDYLEDISDDNGGSKSLNDNFATIRIFRRAYRFLLSLTPVSWAKIATALVLVVLMIRSPVLCYLSTAAKPPAWRCDAEFVSVVHPPNASGGFLGQLVDGILYVHHNYIRIAWYIGWRTFIGLAFGGGLIYKCLQVLPDLGRNFLSMALYGLGGFGDWSKSLFLLTLIATCDSLTGSLCGLAKPAKWVLIKLSLFHYNEVTNLYGMVFSDVKHSLGQVSTGLEKLFIGESIDIPTSRFSTSLFMYIGHPFLGGLPPGGFGGFPGFHDFGWYHVDPFAPIMPGVTPPSVFNTYPGGMFYDIMEPPIVVYQEKRNTHENDQIVKGLKLAALLTSVLLVAPVSEEFVFRRFLGWVENLWCRLLSRRNKSAQELIFGYRPGVLLMSLLFAASHINNHIPPPMGVSKLMQEGTDKACTQLLFAMAQFQVTFWLSLRVFSPMNEKRGLAAAIGAHFMWNACTLILHYQLALRLISCAFWCMVSVCFLHRHTERTKQQLMHQQKSPCAEEVKID